MEAAVALLADDVVFSSPVVFKPYRDRDQIALILRTVAEVFEDFRYVREIGAEGARDHALVFRAQVGGRELEGCDFIHMDDDARIAELTVMIRPLTGAIALAEAMGPRLAAAGAA